MGSSMAGLREDLQGALDFLQVDPLRNVGPIGRLAHDKGWRPLVLGDPVEAVVAIGPRPGQAILVALEGRAAAEAVRLLPPADYHLALSDINLLTQLKEAFEVQWAHEAYFLFTRAEEFRPSGDLQPRPVTPSQAPLIASLWDDEDRTDYIRERLQRGPSVGVWDGDKLVGWYGTHVVTDRSVSMGFLHVLEPYRGRGYAKMLTTALSRIILEGGRVPSCLVEVDNAASLAVHHAVGFQRYCRQGWVGISLP